MAQGIERNKNEVFAALEPYFKMGCSVKKACEYAGIPQSTVQTWIENDPDLRVKVTALQNEPNATARRNWIAKMAEGDFDASKEWIRRKEKDEFSDRTEHTGTDGAPIAIEISEAIAKKNGLAE